MQYQSVQVGFRVMFCFGMWLRYFRRARSTVRCAANTRGPRPLLSFSRNLTVSLCAIVALAGVVPTAFADQSTRPRIAIRVRDTARVPPSILMRALDEVTRIYRQAGVETRWPTSLSHESKAAQTAAFTVAILSEDQVERLSAAVIPNSMGVVTRTLEEGGRVAYVFYDRVHMFTGPNRLHRALVLGVAIAHEIGHLLLPYNTHSQTGLMRPCWTTADLQLAQHGRLLFTAEQGKLLRTHVAALRQSTW